MSGTRGPRPYRPGYVSNDRDRPLSFSKVPARIHEMLERCARALDKSRRAVVLEAIEQMAASLDVLERERRASRARARTRARIMRARARGHG